MDVRNVKKKEENEGKKTKGEKMKIWDLLADVPGALAIQRVFGAWKKNDEGTGLYPLAGSPHPPKNQVKLKVIAKIKRQPARS